MESPAYARTQRAKPCCLHRFDKTGRRAVCRIRNRRVEDRVSCAVQTDGIDRWVRDSEAEVFRERVMGILETSFDVVAALHMGKINPKTCVGEASALAHSFGLIRKKIRARVVLHTILPYERTCGQQCR